MDFTEKLKRLSSGRNKSQIARDAGLSPTAINDYLQRGYTPRADKALTLARALNVPLDWLVDDSQDWPPPHLGEEASLAEIPETALMAEVCTRYLREAEKVLEDVKEAERIDWPAVERMLSKNSERRKLDAQAQRAFSIAESLMSAPYNLTRFDPVNVLIRQRGHLSHELTMIHLLNRIEELKGKNNEIYVIENLMYSHLFKTGAKPTAAKGRLKRNVN